MGVGIHPDFSVPDDRHNIATGLLPQLTFRQRLADQGFGDRKSDDVQSFRQQQNLFMLKQIENDVGPCGGIRENEIHSGAVQRVGIPVLIGVSHILNVRSQPSAIDGQINVPTVIMSRDHQQG